MFTCSSWYRLLPSSPAPVSNTMAVASSNTTSLEPSLRHAVPAEPRLPSARPSRISRTAATESHNGENVLVVHCPAVATRYGAGIGPVVGGVARPQGLRLTEQGA